MRTISWIVAGMAAITVSLLTLSACDDGALTGLDDVDPSAGGNARVAVGDSTARAGGVPGEGASSLDRYALLGRILSADGNPDSVRVHVKSWHTDYNETGYATLGIPAKGTIYHWGAAHSEGVDIHGEGGIPALGRDALYALSFDSPARGDALLVLLPSAVDVDTYFTWDNGDIAITSQAIGARTHILEDISIYNDIGWRKAVCAGGRFGRIVFEGDSLDVSTVLHRRFYGAISGEAEGEIPKDVSGCGTSSDAFDVQLLGFADDDAYQMIDWRPIVSESISESESVLVSKSKSESVSESESVSVSESVSAKSSTASTTASASGNRLNRSKPAGHAPPSVNLSASPGKIDLGNSSTLTWSSSNATSVSISPDVGPDIGTVATSGQRSVSPTTSTTYTIVAKGPGGSKSDRATVKVHMPPSVSFSASPGTINLGGSSTLGWSSEHATLVSIGPDIGLVGASGERSVSPDSTTTYTIVATGADGTSTQRAEATVTVNRPPTANAGADQTVDEGDTVTLSGSGSTDPEGATLTYAWTAPAGTVLSSTTEPYERTFTAPTQLVSDSVLTFTLTVNDGAQDSEADTVAVTVTADAQSDRAALVALYNATDGANWQTNTNWNSSAAIDTWFGVRTDDAGRVVSLDLFRNDLSGSIPAALGDLANLEYLALSNNSLSGSIPAALGDLTSLTNLNLFRNSLSGSIPAELGDLANLTSLSIGENSFSGSIPAALGDLANLDWLNLASNSLSGSIPAALGDLANLTNLNLSGNSLSGSIPAALGDLANLRRLWIGENDLSGSIPAAFVNLDNLILLQVDNELCVPGDTAFQQWLGDLDEFEGDSDNICNQPPVADAGADQTVDEGDTVTLSGSGSTDAEGASLTYAWGAPASISLSDTTAQSPTFAAPTELLSDASLTFTLTVNDGTQDSEADTVAVTVTAGPNDAPTANAGVDQTVDEGDTVTLSGSGTDPEGATLTYAWGAPASISLSDATAQSPTFTAPTELLSDSVLTFTLTVNDGAQDSEADTVAVTVTATATANDAPTADAGADQTVDEGDTVTLSGSGTDPEGATLTYAWGAPASISLSDATAQSPTFTAPTELLSNAVLTFTLTVNDGAQDSEADTVVVTVYQKDRAALVAFYNATDGANWSRNTNWNGSAAIGTWYGVATDDAGRVDSLTLLNTSLSGSIPAELGDLTSLEELNLHDNSLSGSIPAELGDLTNLEGLTLTYNDLSGSIPAALGDLTNLEKLRLSGNDLTGSIPAALGDLTNLESLALDNNDLSGSIPAALGDLTNLEWLTLDGNSLTGSIPVEFVNLDDLLTLQVDNELCVPGSTAFQQWLGDLDEFEGDSDNICNDAPTANAGADQTVAEGATVTLSGSGTDSNGNALINPTYAWGAPASITLSDTTAASPTFTAPTELLSDSVLEFTLTVNDGTQDSEADTVVVTVTAGTNDAPTADAGVDQTVDEGDAVTLSGSGTDPEGATLTYAWGAPASITLSDATSQSPTFTAPTDLLSDEVLEFTLTVNDGTQDSEADTVTVTVEAGDNDAPTANAGADQTVAEGATVTLSGSGTDPEGASLTYAWGAPASITLSDATAQSPTFAAPTELLSDAPLTFTLTVNDGTQDSEADTVVVTVTAGTNDAPTADAGADQTVDEGDTVTLSGSGTDPEGASLTYAWGAPASITLSDATSQSPTFAAPTELLSDASLEFTLVVNDGVNDSAKDTVAVTVTAGTNDAPTADAGADQTVAEGATVTLSGSGTDPEGATLSYAWGAPASITLSDATSQSPTFAAPTELLSDASLTFTLTVNDGTQDSEADTVTVTVEAGDNDAPTADAGADQTVDEGDTVTLSGSGTDPEGASLSYAWGAPASITLSDATSQSPTFAAPTELLSDASLTFTLTVNDGTQDSEADTVTVTVEAGDNDAPTANAGVDQTVAEGATVTLSGSGTDPEGASLSYAWGAPASITLSDATSQSPTFAAPTELLSDASLTFTLTVNDGTQDSEADTVTVTVEAGDNDAPTANAGVDQTVAEGATVTLSGSGTDPEGASLSYAWGAPASITLSDATSQSPTFAAPTELLSDASLTFTLTVNDGTQDSEADTVTVTVEAGDNDAPTADAGADQTVDEGDTVTLDGSGSSDPEGASLSYAWDAPASITLSDATSQSPTFAAPTELLSDASLTFTLTVNDGTQDSEADTVTVTVEAGDNDAPTADAGADQTVDEGDTVTLDGSGSSDPEGADLDYDWDAPAGITLSDATTQSPSFAAPTQLLSDASLTFTLTVYDGVNYSAEDQVTVTVEAGDNDAPTANAGPDQTVAEGATVTLSGSGTDPEGAALTYTWTAPTDITLSSTTAQSPTFTAPTDLLSDEVLEFTLTVNDGTNNSAADTVTVTVNASPTVTLSANPGTICRGGSSMLTWSSTNATSVSISPGIGSVALSGSEEVSPTSTTTYTATATNPAGSNTDQATVTVINQSPTITSFTASPSTIYRGSNSTLSWSSTNAASVSINQGIGSVAASGTRSVSPTSTTTYTITATNACGSVTATATVTVIPPPTVEFEDPDPGTICDGQSSTLEWSSTNATSVSISPGIGSVAASGTRSVYPTSTTTYTITATNPAGSDTDQATVTVINQSPTITSFTASPSTIYRGSNSTLSWSSTNAASVSINQGIGSVAASGTRSVSPTSTTTYTITATNACGSVTATATVTVIPPPTVEFEDPDPVTICDGQSSTLEWSSTNATSVSISPGIGSVAASGTRSVSPTSTTTYTITATNPAGSDTDQATVTVIDQSPTVSLSAFPGTIDSGDPSTLTWSSTNAASVSIDQGIGEVDTDGEQEVSPTSTTTYTITATNACGSVTATATVTVNLTASITGPTLIPLLLESTWGSTVTGGTPPYTYSWHYGTISCPEASALAAPPAALAARADACVWNYTGAGSGSSYSYTPTTWPSGRVRLIVSDSASPENSVTKTLDVTVDP